MSAATDSTDQKISGVSVVIRVLSQFSGASQKNSTPQAARTLSAGLSAHHNAAPSASGSSTMGRRMDHRLSPSVARINAISQPTMGG
jgi:hypothetical protein